MYVSFDDYPVRYEDDGSDLCLINFVDVAQFGYEESLMIVI